MPKVSIIMPSFNVAPYIRECMDSVVNQTLSDIEIIVVDAFSTDGTREILQEYASKEHRIKILDDDKGSTGYANNIAIEAASGEYIGILETDDFVTLDMYEKLYALAKTNDCDIVKGDYASFSGNGENRLYVHHNLIPYPWKYEKVINPREDKYILDAVMFNWAGIYKKSFLQKNNIKHQESPGASFQDNGFFVQCYVLAEKVLFTHQSFYRYRKDNPNSSINNPNKIFCMCDEYDFVENQLLKFPDIQRMFNERILRRRYFACTWTLKKVAAQYREALTERLYKDFKARVKNDAQIAEIQPKKKYQKEMKLLLNDKDDYLNYMVKTQNGYDANIKNLCKKLSSKKKLVIFGAGEEGNVLRDILFENGLAVSCIVDNDKSKWGLNINGTEIKSLKDAKRTNKDAFYIIAMRRHTQEVRKQLRENEITDKNIYTFQSWRFVWD
ncbi:MAG: glycosyltransferase [Pseudobutyrivibrio sp.]|nr:glycosyltransferase [Pseudobutyrivibrio sp.]